MRQAVAYNFLSATTCYVGLFLGIALGEFTQDTTAVFAVAAGMFLYIALVDMVSYQFNFHAFSSCVSQ